MSKTPSNSVHLKTRAEWRNWLEQHHEREAGAWLISFKKASGKPRFDDEESVEGVLCFGRIDRGS